MSGREIWHLFGQWQKDLAPRFKFGWCDNDEGWGLVGVGFNEEAFGLGKRGVENMESL